MLNSLEAILSAAVAKGGSKVLAVAKAEDREVLSAIKDARELGLATAILVGEQPQIESIALEVGLDLEGIEVIHATEARQVARTAVELVSSGRAQILMKGLVSTGEIMRAVLDKQIGLRSGRVISHVALLEPPGYGRLLLMTDGGMVIAPDLQQKAQMIENAVMVARKLGNECPKVAVIAAFEQVNPDMPATTEAALLAKMADRGQIKHCLVDGPIALDGAVSKEAAEHKGMVSPVAGEADILLMPMIEAGNVMYKTIVYLSGGQVAGVIAGAAAPIVLTSRADTHQAKLYSIATAVLMC
ncbi:MAG: phosphate butyryltransferase [Bacillota bacterium]|jgi:phosphate butyryltransferase